jgi:hypothetical protein
VAGTGFALAFVTTPAGAWLGIVAGGTPRYLIPKQTGLRLDLERYLRYYNTERAHTGRWTRGRTPEAVLGKAKLWQKKR